MRVKLEGGTKIPRTIDVKVFSPLGFTVWVCSNKQPIQIQSRQDVMTEGGLNPIALEPVNFSAVPGKTYHVFQRFNVTLNSEEEAARLIFRYKCADSYLDSYFKFILIDRSQPSSGSKEKKYLELYNQERLAPDQELSLTKSDQGYSLLVEGILPYTVMPETALNLDFLSSNPGVAIEPVEQLDPLEYSEAYLPHKYGIIFKEKVFVGDTTLASLYVSISG